jgi:hypothetical protein
LAMIPWEKASITSRSVMSCTWARSSPNRR